jgi:hypothetical protein
MWILPRQLHTSPFVPDTEALISDLNEQSQACAQSLLVRSKPSPARTWSLKWKRDSWTALLSGRILKPSHGPSFTAAWTSSLAATRANPSAQPASGSAPKTHDTSGPTYQPELLQCDQVPVSLRMSRDISALGFPTCCKTWQEWVTERRGAWRQRVNAARLTRGSGSLSWPSASSRDWKGAPASRVTPEGYNARLDEAVILFGQAAPANPSTDGSRQGLWLTPCANNPNEGETPMVERQQSGKLNPRWVETLMGLPIGWTMPSCTSPQTIAPMSCDSSAMELCQPPQSGPSEFSLAS